MTHTEWPHLNDEVRDSWNQNAKYWDNRMGDEGNANYKDLIRPTTDRLLELQPGERVLEIGCGNGNFARHMARLGAEVIATDISTVMIAQAQVYPLEPDMQVSYQVVDATNREQLLALGDGQFEAAVSNMAIMDMSAIEPLLQSLRRLLKPGGRFVFSTMHPCFMPHGTKIVQQHDRGGQITTEYGIKVTNYIKPAASQGLAIVGQPAVQYYFHRPLSVLFRACFEAGFVLDALEEPMFAETTEPNKDLSWANFKEIPVVLAARLRLLTD